MTDSRIAADPPRMLPASGFAAAPRFPAIGFRGFEQYWRWLQTAEPLLDARRVREASHATVEPALTLAGTCAACLTPALFTAETRPGTRLPDGRFVPDWAGRLVCDCTDRLNRESRAVLHFVRASGVAPFTRLLLAGPADPGDARLMALAASTDVIQVLHAGITPAPGAYHLVVSKNYLHNLVDFSAALAALAAALVRGGRFIFTAAFQPSSQQSAPPAAPGTNCIFGWDLLDRLREAGFSDAVGYLVWSEELGYLGPGQFIFRATR